MVTSTPFETHAIRYDRWFERHESVYHSELDALSRLVVDPGFGLEIGVGTGRFGVPLGFDVGVDPALAMLDVARDRGIQSVRGVGERLPFSDGTFDTTLMVTTVCFVDDLERTLTEAYRVLTTDGSLIIGFIDRASPLGERYLASKGDNPFYEQATFVSSDELLERLDSVGFTSYETVQTIFSWPEEVDQPEPIRPGHGSGSFVALRADR